MDIVKYNNVDIINIKQIFKENEENKVAAMLALSNDRFSYAEPFILKIVDIFNAKLTNKDFKIVTIKEKHYLPNKWWFIPQTPIIVNTYVIYIKRTFTIRELFEGLGEYFLEDYTTTIANYFSIHYDAVVFKERATHSIELTLKLSLRE